MTPHAPTPRPTLRRLPLLLALAAAAGLAACGGGSGGASSEPPAIAAPADAPGHADAVGDVVDDALPAAPVPSGDRSLVLAWEAPRTNEDGSPLTDLAGYRIYYGSRPGHYTAAVAVDDPAALSHRLESLAPGTYYVVVKAVNSAGAQSIASPEASKTIQ